MFFLYVTSILFIFGAYLNAALLGIASLQRVADSENESPHH